jgi:FtsZ family, C-terminal domain
MGTAMMGTGEAGGEQRAIVASEEAIVNPLLDDITLKGARSLLLSITGGRDLTLWEVDEAANRVRQEVDPDANIIVGATFDDSLGDKVRVSIVASGMGGELHQMRRPEERRHTAAKEGPWPPVARVSPDFRQRLTAAIDDHSAVPGTSARAVAETAWRAPGDVFIREAPSLGDEGAETGGFARRPPWEAATADQRLQDDGDEGPSPPSEVPKVYRRHVELPPARSGLLRRLAGVGRSGKGVATPEGPTRAAPSDEADEIELPVFFGRGKR